MKRMQQAAASAALALIAAAPLTGVHAQEVDLSGVEARFSYAVGLNVARDLVNSDLQIQPDAFILALEDILNQNPPRLTNDEIATAVAEMTAAMETERMASMSAVTEQGDNMREEFSKKDGVKSTASGLLYKVYANGSGDSPKITDTVVVHYRGRLVDGTEFDSSFSRNAPTTFKLMGIIPGWQEALQLMSVGSKWTIVLPPELGYGAEGAPPVIPPGATLIFDIELLEIQ